MSNKHYLTTNIYTKKNFFWNLYNQIVTNIKFMKIFYCYLLIKYSILLFMLFAIQFSFCLFSFLNNSFHKKWLLKNFEIKYEVIVWKFSNNSKAYVEASCSSQWSNLSRTERAISASTLNKLDMYPELRKVTMSNICKTAEKFSLKSSILSILGEFLLSTYKK